ncbi:MAG: hypothetical protein ACKERG_04295 [Candidatus Hodgkinia cicadicola]
MKGKRSALRWAASAAAVLSPSHSALFPSCLVFRFEVFCFR